MWCSKVLKGESFMDLIAANKYNRKTIVRNSRLFRNVRPDVKVPESSQSKSVVLQVGKKPMKEIICDLG